MFIKNFNSFINESVKINGVKNADILLLYKEAVNFYLKSLFNTDDIHITIYFKKLNKKTIGDVNLKEHTNENNNKFKVNINSNNGMSYNLGSIAHELTHIKQIYYNELKLSKGFIYWKDKPYISIKEYSGIIHGNKIEEYKKLPWEEEAYTNQKLLPNTFKESDEINQLKTVNNILMFLIDSI